MLPKGTVLFGSILHSFVAVLLIADAAGVREVSYIGAILDSVADIVFVACCAIRLFPALKIPVWLWIWAGMIVIIKMVNQISALAVCKRFCFLHTTANKMTGLLLFLAVPTVFWSIILLAVVAGIATFAAIQEGHYIRTGRV